MLSPRRLLLLALVVLVPSVAFAQQPPPDPGPEDDDPVIEDADAPIPKLVGRPIDRIQFRGNRKVFLAYAPVRTGRWSMLVVAPVDEALAGAHAVGRALLIIGGAVLVLLCLAIALVAGRVTRPVRAFVDRLQSLQGRDVAELRAGMEAMARGDLTVEAHASTEPLGDAGADEIGRASRTLDELIACTHASVEAYDTTRAELGRMIGGVSASAAHVARASHEMASTSHEAGRAIGEIAAAVSEVALRRRTHAHAALRSGQQRHVVLGHVGRVDGREALAEHADVVEQSERRAAVGVVTLVVLDRLFRHVGVEDAVVLLGPLRDDGHGGRVDGPDGVDRGADTNVPVEIGG